MKGVSVMENKKGYKFLDLEKEVVIFDGERLTEERVVQLGEELIAEFYRQKGIKFDKED
jgi:hypothetical protein